MPGGTDTVVSGGTTSIVYVKPRDIDPSSHLRNAGGWSQWVNDVRGALGGDYWNCTIPTPIQKPNARTDLEHANFQAVALLRRSVSLNIKKQIKDGFDHTLTDISTLVDGPVRGYLTAAMSTLDKPSLILDSGATHHIVNKSTGFTR